MASGYSGTPLAKKLSLKDGMRVWWDGMPASVREEIAAEGLQLQRLDTPEPPIEEAPDDAWSQRGRRRRIRSYAF